MARSTNLPRSTRRGDKKRRQIRLGWYFIAIWGLSVGLFDGLVLWSAARQIEAGWNWTSVPGTVTSGRIVSTRSSKGGTTYRPEITFSYRVGDREFVGSDVDLGGLIGSSKKRAERIMADFPAGSNPPVFVDPRRPERSALIVGLQPPVLRMVVFLIPFNAVLLGGMLFLLRAKRYADDPMQRWITRDDGNRVVLRITQATPETLGLVTSGVLAFVGVFVLHLGFGRDPSLGTTVIVLAGVILAGVFVFVWRKSTIASGSFDIQIDRDLRRITPPRTRGELETPEIRFEDLVVEIEEDAYRRVDRGHAWKLKLAGRDGVPVYTGLWIHDTDARRLGAWIARQCKVCLKIGEPDDD